MRYVKVKKIYSDAEMNEKQGTFFEAPALCLDVVEESDLVEESEVPNRSSTLILKEDCNVYTEEGKLLLKFRKNKISKSYCDLLFNNMKGAAVKTRGRAIAAGIPKEGIYSYVKSKTSGKMIHQLNSKAPSGFVGYYDNKSFFGYKNITESLSLCRTTAYTSKYFQRFQACLPAFKRINDIYKSLVPIHYKNQKKAILKIDPEYVIKDTIFTTVTVNKNFRTALHKDSGDYKRGFGNLIVCSEGDYSGGYTLFPQYGIGIDCRNGDFLAMNVHEWHCNSAITAPKDGPQGTRMSFVFYLREKMISLCPLKK